MGTQIKMKTSLMHNLHSRILNLFSFLFIKRLVFSRYFFEVQYIQVYLRKIYVLL